MSKKVWFCGKNCKKVKPSSSPSSMNGCHSKRRKFVFHNEGVNRNCDGGQHVINLAKYVNSQGSGIYYHFIYCPDCGQWAQAIPVDKAARSLKGGAVDSCGASGNRCGKVAIQVCFAGYGSKKLPNPKNWKNKGKFKKIAKEWGIKPKARNFEKVNRSKSKWNDKAIGYHAHSHAPNNDHHDIVGNKLDWKNFKKHVLEID